MLARKWACVLGMSVLWQCPGVALAICRVVEPIEERGGVWFDPNTMVLYVVAPGQTVGHECLAYDGGVGASGFTPDASGTRADDAGVDDDAGARGEDAGSEPGNHGDGATAGTVDAGGADCPAGTQVAVEGTVIHMVVQPAVLTAGGRAGLIMPVPARPDIHAANDDVFHQLGMRLEPDIETRTEYVEDASLGYQCRDPKGGSGGCMGDDTSYEYAEDDYGPVGSDRGAFYDPDTEDGALDRVMIADGVVRFEDALSTADYDVTVLNATTFRALRGWLDGHGFAHDAEDDEAFRSYVTEGAWFVALDVHPSMHGSAGGALSPLVVSWRGEHVPLLHRLQFHADGGEITTEAFVMAPTRMDAADGSAETLYAAPAGFGGAVAGFGLAEGWLTQIRLTRRLDEWKEDSVLYAAGDYEVRPVLERIERIRIPSSECPASSSSDGCLCRANQGTDAWSGSLAPITLAALWLLARKRRRTRLS